MILDIKNLTNFFTTKYNLYEDNSILKYYPYNIMDQLKNEKVYLYGRKFIGLNLETIVHFSLENLSSLQNKCNTSKLLMLIGVCLFAFIFVIYGLISLSIYLWASCKGNKDLFYDYIFMDNFKNGSRNKGLIKYYCIFSSIALILEIIASCALSVNVIKIKPYYNNYESDEYTNELLQMEINKTNINYTLSILNICFLIITIISLIFLIVNRVLIYLKKKQNQ